MSTQTIYLQHKLLTYNTKKITVLIYSVRYLRYSTILHSTHKKETELTYNVRYATNKTILYLQYNTYDTYILIYILMIITIKKKKHTATCVTYNMNYRGCKIQEKGGGWYLLVSCTSNSKIFSLLVP